MSNVHDVRKLEAMLDIEGNLYPPCKSDTFRNAYLRCVVLLSRVIDEDPRSDLPEDLIDEIMGELRASPRTPLSDIQRLYDKTGGR